MLKEQRRTKDLEARKKIIHAIQRYAAEQVYFVYLNSSISTASLAASMSRMLARTSPSTTAAVLLLCGWIGEVCGILHCQFLGAGVSPAAAGWKPALPGTSQQHRS